MLRLKEKVKIEHAKNSYFIVDEKKEQVIILKEREKRIIDMLLVNNLDDVVDMLSKEYVGEHIREDIMEFCKSLSELGIMEERIE